MTLKPALLIKYVEIARRSLLLTGSEHRVFFEDPISLGLLILDALFVVGSAGRDLRDASKRRAVAADLSGQATSR